MIIKAVCLFILFLKMTYTHNIYNLLLGMVFSVMYFQKKQQTSVICRFFPIMFLMKSSNFKILFIYLFILCHLKISLEANCYNTQAFCPTLA